MTEGSVTAPKFEDSPAAYAVWVLERHADVYREFRRLCDERLRENPSGHIGSKQIVEVMRWFSGSRMDGDLAKINNNVTSLFARLYVLERPEHEDAFATRRSVWDSLTPEENERLLLAFERIRTRKWR